MIVYEHKNKEYRADLCVCADDPSDEYPREIPLLSIVCRQDYPSGEREYAEHHLSVKEADQLSKKIHNWVQSQREKEMRDADAIYRG